MSPRVKIYLAIFVFLGFLFLTLGIYQWYDLHQIEQGAKEGNLSIILNTVYGIAGKWGVALVYMTFAGYCFWRAYTIFTVSKNEEIAEDENNEILDNERK